MGERMKIEDMTPLEAYKVGYENGESNLLADVNTLCDQLGIDLGGRSEFEAIRSEVESLRAKVTEFEEREEDRRQDWLEKT